MAVEDAILLSRTCKKVYLVHRRDELRAEKFFRTAYLPAIMLNWCGTVYRYLWKVRTK